MGAVELRDKWIQSIGKVDDRFLRMIDALYESYVKDETDFFDELPKEIQELIDEGLEEVKLGKVRTHSEVIADYKEKYNIVS
ncbi:hypothetical protein [uncultured Algibacter sp.]|uniref:hypothetical protein n=1 Tax=uncultured Algibacter sp. TaxID=298659 RepID=UPI003216A64D